MDGHAICQGDALPGSPQFQAPCVLVPQTDRLWLAATPQTELAQSKSELELPCGATLQGVGDLELLSSERPKQQPQRRATEDHQHVKAGSSSEVLEDQGDPLLQGVGHAR